MLMPASSPSNLSGERNMSHSIVWHFVPPVEVSIVFDQLLDNSFTVEKSLAFGTCL
jgi:hypothetical protein